MTVSTISSTKRKQGRILSRQRLIKTDNHCLTYTKSSVWKHAELFLCAKDRGWERSPYDGLVHPLVEDTVPCSSSRNRT